VEIVTDITTRNSEFIHCTQGVSGMICIRYAQGHKFEVKQFNVIGSKKTPKGLTGYPKFEVKMQE
jgi:hypothetical protein